jgi:hypothetical protein
MNLDTLRAGLPGEAETWVKRFVEKRGGFTMFALAKHRDGGVNPLQPTDEFPDQKSAMVETYRLLMALAKDNEIVASVICTPISEGKEAFAMYDLESKDSGRVLVLVPMKKRLLGGWSFGYPRYKRDGARVFAS